MTRWVFAFMLSLPALSSAEPVSVSVAELFWAAFARELSQCESVLGQDFQMALWEPCACIQEQPPACYLSEAEFASDALCFYCVNRQGQSLNVSAPACSTGGRSRREFDEPLVQEVLLRHCASNLP